MTAQHPSCVAGRFQPTRRTVHAMAEKRPIRKYRRSKSATAVFVAAIRAGYLRFYDAPIFEDTFALQMLPPFWRAAASFRPLNWLVGDIVLGVHRPVHPVVILRARYAEDQLDEAIEQGVNQYVILGAGFDTFALRRKELADRIRVFEVDHPATQEVKRKRIRRAGGSIPDNLTLVPVDFERDSLDEELLKAGFDTRTPAFYSWLGVTYYLTEEAIRDTLTQIAGITAPGSRIVLDFKVAKQMISPEWREICERMERFVARRGEPMRTDFTPQTLRDAMARYGYVEIEMMPPEKQKSRYLEGRADLRPPEFFHFALFAVQPSGELRSP